MNYTQENRNFNHLRHYVQIALDNWNMTRGNAKYCKEMLERAMSDPPYEQYHEGIDWSRGYGG